MFYTYILKSINFPKTYVGHTKDIEKRVLEHNNGKSIYSRRYKPWVIIHVENFSNLEMSVKKEKYFKSAAGRRWVKKNLFDK